MRWCSAVQCTPVQCSACLVVPRRGRCGTWSTASAGWRASPAASCSPSAWTPVEEPAAWQKVAAGLAACGMPGAWPAVPVLEQAECWLAGLPSWTSALQCGRRRRRWRGPEPAKRWAGQQGRRQARRGTSREQMVERAEVVLPLAEEGDRDGPCGKLAAAGSAGRRWPPGKASRCRWSRWAGGARVWWMCRQQQLEVTR